MSRTSRSRSPRVLGTAAAAFFALTATGVPADAGGPVAPSPPREVTSCPHSPPEEPAELVTYSGVAADAAIAFEHPSAWTVEEDFTDVGGTATVLGENGAPIASLGVFLTWGAVCGPDCTMPPVLHLEDVPGDEPLSNSGDFVVRTVAMDLTGSPELREAYEWSDNVRVVTSLTDAEVPVPTEMIPFVMYGVGLIETEVVAPHEIYYRPVIFSSTRDFATLKEAEDYASSVEHRQVQEMIASFRG